MPFRFPDLRIGGFASLKDWAGSCVAQSAGRRDERLPEWAGRPNHEGLTAEERIGSNDPTQGAGLIHTIYSSPLLERIFATGEILSRCSEQSIGEGFDSFEFPRVLDADKQTMPFAGLQVYWAQDGVPVPWSSVKLEWRKYSLSAIRGLLRISEKNLRDSAAVGSYAMRTMPQAFEYELDALLRAADAPHHVVATYMEQCPDRKGVVFTVSVKGAHEMAEAFRAAGVPAEALDGSLARDHRRAVLARLRSGETRVVANAAVLTEGWDEPSISCVVIARPTRSRALAIQMIGRGLRPFPGKAACLVIDTVGMSRRTDLVTLASLAGVTKRQAAHGLRTAILDQAEAAAATVAQEATEEQLALDAAAAPRQDDGTLIYRQFDLRTGSRLHWVETCHGQWVLSMGKQGSVHVAPDPAGFRVVRLWRGEDGGHRKAVVKVTPSLEEAQAEAEARVRKVGMAQANSRSAEWRRRPPTLGQVQLLGKLGLVLPPTIGEASDLITAHLTRAVWAFSEALSVRSGSRT